MELRIFQIVVPAIALLFSISLIDRFRKGKSTVYETLLSVIFWLLVAVFAIFPDAISNFIARSLGIKSNVNAIIFFCLGLIFFFQFKIYHQLKKQERDITQLTRNITLEEVSEKEES